MKLIKRLKSQLIAELVLKGFKEFNFGLSHSVIIRKENMRENKRK